MPQKKKQKNSDKKIAALYCRVSRFDKYADKFSSVEVQEKKMRGYCELEEWEIFDYLFKTDTGGKPGIKAIGVTPCVFIDSLLNEVYLE